jgi:folate-binding protein YgfZ
MFVSESLLIPIERGLIAFCGEDAQIFLQGQLSCDVNAVTAARSSYGGYCTPQGRVLATFLLWRMDDRFFMQLPVALCEPIRKRLAIFILRSKVKAQDVTRDWTAFGVTGEGSAARIERAFGSVPAADHHVVHVAGVTIIRLPVERFELIVPADRAQQAQDSLAPVCPADASLWDYLDIRAGIPVITPPVQGEFVPQMLNLDLIGAVSFSKGCYPGQEIIARTHYRGQVKQRLYFVRMASGSALQAGDKLYSPGTGEQACGLIVNATPSPAGGYEALAVIHTSSAEAGIIRWGSRDGPRLAVEPLRYSAGTGTPPVPADAA